MGYTRRLVRMLLRPLFFTPLRVESMDITAIETRILQAMPEAQVKVESDDNVHYVARIVSDSFVGLSRIQRHRKVHAAVGEALGREIHAMSLDLKTTEEAGQAAVDG